MSNGKSSWVRLAMRTVVILSLVGCIGWLIERDRQHRIAAQEGVDALLAEFPLASLEHRLPREPGWVGPLHQAAAEHLTHLEQYLDRDQAGGRGYALYRLHEETEKVFALSPGFGPQRGFRFTDLLRKRPDPLWRLGQEDEPDPATTYGGAFRLEDHTRSVARFAAPTDTGYFKDRRHVAGFRPHRLSEPPAPPMNWSLRSLELIGLIVHEKPTAYIFDGLPRMTDVSQVPTRSLDDFESAALTELRGGEILVVQESPAELRVLGGIRAAKQCVACHGGGRGALLGAFSYTLTAK